jgi:hypothetical protein
MPADDLATQQAGRLFKQIKQCSAQCWEWTMEDFHPHFSSTPSYHDDISMRWNREHRELVHKASGKVTASLKFVSLYTILARDSPTVSHQSHTN